MNQKAAGRTAQDVLDSITPAVKSWLSKVKPEAGEIEANLQRLAKEGKTKTILKGQQNAGRILTDLDEYRDIEEMLDIKFSQDEINQIDKLLSKVTHDNIDDTFKKIHNIAGNDKEKLGYVGSIRRGVDEQAATISRNDFKDTTLEGVNKYFNMPRAYFDVTDDSIKKARIATAVGGYAAVSVGGRYLSGGTLTRDNYWQKDIAGVPFF